MPVQFRFGDRTSNFIESVDGLRMKHVGMRDELRSFIRDGFDDGFRVQFEQGIESPGMVEMPMRKDNEIALQQVDLHPVGVEDERMGIPNVEEDLFGTVLNQIRDPRLAKKVPVDECIVVY